eukprot:TRINITY_DN3567_c0_g1_i1.p1 TRINITY_DN3567_c0_g1~~TRINITY_DN3567_c0_g1_i1.p1  ORF type:complete len:204 (-),score=40.23 TRINITY_DN3567_c0_g1_i1:326-937(-)
MFVLVVIKDKIKLPPVDLEDILRALKFHIEKKYSDKVIPEVGLAIIVHDILQYEQGIVFPGDGSAHVEVTFRLVVFRPFVGEVLCGTVKSCGDDGIVVSLDFFDHIFIPPDSLQPGSYYEEKAKLWVWPYSVDGVQYDLIMNLESKIRFRVETITFNPPNNKRKIEYKQKLSQISKARGLDKRTENIEDTVDDVIVTPMVVVV